MLWGVTPNKRHVFFVFIKYLISRYQLHITCSIKAA
jgi:hypothetical protein